MALVAVTCTLIASFLQQPPPSGGGFDSATCVAGTGGCDCDVDKKTVEDVAEGFLKANGLI